MSARTKARTTLKDLYSVPDDSKPEIINGELVSMSPTQRGPNRVAGKIYSSLEAYEDAKQNGYAFTDRDYILDAPIGR